MYMHTYTYTCMYIYIYIHICTSIHISLVVRFVVRIVVAIAIIRCQLLYRLARVMRVRMQVFNISRDGSIGWEVHP